MILGDKQILAAVESGDIIIEPFNRRQLGSNSYDVCLGKTLALYKDDVLDAKVENKVEYREIGREGIVLVPNRLYLGVTDEYVGSSKYIPFLDGKSSSGRLGISVHVTAGRGDLGFLTIGQQRCSSFRPLGSTPACRPRSSSSSSRARLPSLMTRSHRPSTTVVTRGPSRR